MKHSPFQQFERILCVFEEPTTNKVKKPIIYRDPTGIFEKTCMKKCQKMQKKMLNNANFISKNMKSMLKSGDMVHNLDY